MATTFVNTRRKIRISWRRCPVEDSVEVVRKSDLLSWWTNYGPTQDEFAGGGAKSVDA
jgi:hypothetical protein